VVVAGAVALPRFSDVVDTWLPEAVCVDSVVADLGRLDLVVFDDYAVDAAEEERWRTAADRLMVIDDLANRRHGCDVLVDSGRGPDDDDYRPLVDPACRLLLGPDYAVVDPAFARARGRSLRRLSRSEGAKSLLISFGLTDPGGHALRTARVLAERTDLQLTIAVSARSPSAGDLKRLAATHARSVHLVLDCDDMAALLADCDLVVGSSGVSAWERCTLGVPSVAVVVADNQRRIATRLAESGAAIVVDATAPDLERGILTAVQRCREASVLERMAHAAARTCDGLGGGRLALTLDPEKASDGGDVTVRPVVPADMEMLYDWQRQPETRRYANNAGVPSLPEHAAWLRNALDDPGRILNVIVCNGHDVGCVHLAWDADREGYVVSIHVIPEMFGRGVGSAGLRAAHRLVPTGRFLATVLPGNHRSRRLFTRLGYARLSDTLYDRISRS
jgi:UDP-2,4-diacetamido-2,4,6-trideoxy-beta-L-altropyranose hydrolase